MSRARSETAARSCPCGSGRRYEACCGQFHAGAIAPDAEALMRSRYCAYVREDAAHLLATWHPTTRPRQLSLGAEPAVCWLGLQADYDLEEARRRLGARLEREVHRHAA